jgi:hypothetical protein
MMRYLQLSLVILLLLPVGLAFGQTFPEMTIREATEVPLDSLLKLEQMVDPTSPDAIRLHRPPTFGDTISVSGVVTVNPFGPGGDNRRTLQLGNAIISYIQDPFDPEWGGLHIREDDTLNLQTGLDQFVDGDIIRVTGVMNEFGTTPSATQMALLKTTQVEWLGNVAEIDTIDAIPHTVLPISEFLVGSGVDRQVKYSTAERWKGIRARFENVRVVQRSQASSGRWAWWIRDEEGNDMYVYDSSKYFRGGPDGTADPNWAPPPLNALINIQGVIMTQALTSGGYVIQPIYEGDIEVIAVPPVIENIARNLPVPTSADEVTISATVIPPSEEIDVDSVFVYYSVDGGEDQKLEMINTEGQAYEANIPAQDDRSLVTYYIGAYWAGAQVTNPIDTDIRRFFYLVVDGALTIQDVNYTPFTDGRSSMLGAEVTVSGVVTATEDDIGMVIIQNGQGEWSGIWIVGEAVTDELARGDSVTVTGIVQEQFSFNRIYDVEQLEVHASGVPVPEPELLTTGRFRTGRPTGHPDAEPWKGVLVRFEDMTISNDDPDNNNHIFREWVVDDGTGGMRAGGGTYRVPEYSVLETDEPEVLLRNGMEISSLTGIMYFSFSNFKLVPRRADDFGTVTSVKELVADLPRTFVLRQNYPNPFNPSTNIVFSLPNDAYVTLYVYNVLGQQVDKLVDEYLNAGTYTTQFNARGLSSGIYFYRLEAGDFSEVKRMVFMK